MHPSPDLAASQILLMLIFLPSRIALTHLFTRFACLMGGEVMHGWLEYRFCLCHSFQQSQSTTFHANIPSHQILLNHFSGLIPYTSSGKLTFLSVSPWKLFPISALALFQSHRICHILREKGFMQTLSIRLLIAPVTLTPDQHWNCMELKRIRHVNFLQLHALSPPSLQSIHERILKSVDRTHPNPSQMLLISRPRLTHALPVIFPFAQSPLAGQPRQIQFSWPQLVVSKQAQVFETSTF